METSVQMDGTTRKRPLDEHGKYRIGYFYYKNTSGAALAAGTQIDLMRLPSGAVRILPGLSRLRHTAFGTARTLDIGHRAYYDKSEVDSAEVAEDPNAFVAALAIAAAGENVTVGTDIKHDLYSRKGPVIFATVNGDTIPVDAELEGFFAYVYE